MTDPNLLRANTTSLNPLITDDKVSAFIPTPPQAIADHLRDTKYLQAQNVTGFGTTNRWELTKQGTSLQSITLRMQFSPLAIISGTFARYQDFTGLAAIQELRILYNGNLIYKYGRDYMFSRGRKWLTDEKRSCWNEAISGEKTPAQRSAAAQAGFVTYTHLMIPTSFATDQATPIVTLSQKLTLEIDTDTAVNLIQTDGVISDYAGAVVALDILPDYIHTIENDTQWLVDKSKTDNGIPYLISNKTYIQKLPFSAAAGTPSSEFRLLTRGVVKELMFYLVPQRLTQTAGSNEYFQISNNPFPLPPLMNAYQEIIYFEVKANGVDAVRNVTTPLFEKSIYHPFYHSSRFGDNIYFWSWSVNPETENAAFGNLAFANLDTPVLILYYGPLGTGLDPVTGLSQVLVLNVIYYVYSYIQFQGGDVTEVFT